MSARSHAVRGIALLTVLAILTLSVLLALAALRTTLLQQMMAGQQSDQQRTQAAAEAMVREAERDILGLAPDGGPCRPAGAGVAGCRLRGGGALPQAPYFPHTAEEFEEVREWLWARGAQCSAGICVPTDLAALASLADDAAAMRKLGATYGQFTQAANSAVRADDPVLASQPARAWYWAELLWYDTGSDALAARGHLQPDPTRPFVYRITALALGLRPGTRAVVRSYFVPFPAGQLP